MKIYDCFLFFNELDLLEIRLDLLYPHVDYFVIVESEVTFQGEIKNFNFESNKNRFEKYLDKIFYYKLAKYSIDFNSLPILENPRTNDEILLNKIYRFVEQADNFDKNHYWWGNDNFQRECIWRALALLNPKDSDMIILSDADEIPSTEALEKIKNQIKSNTLYTCKMYEFYYFLNYYHNSDWFGSCTFLYGSFKNFSMNKIRIYRTGENALVSAIIIENAGWHFTSLGNVRKISHKIKSWGHKEFNNMIVLSSLLYNIRFGYDIFRRKNFGILKFMHPEDDIISPIFKLKCSIPAELIGPKIAKENFMQKLIFSIYFKIANRFFQCLAK